MTVATKAAPKYLQIASRLREQIAQGELKPGDRLPSFVAMRADFGATPATVERVFAELERDELIHRRPGKGTFVAEAPRPLSTGLIGFVGRSFALRDEPFFGHIAAGIEDVIRREDKRIVLLDHESPRGWDQVDGVLVCRQDHVESMLRHLPPHVPCVTLMLSTEGHSSVVGDDFDGAYKAVNHLLALGHRRIAFLTQPGCPIMRQRGAGYLDALREAGIGSQWWRQSPVSREGYIADYRDWGRTNMCEWIEDDWFEQGCTAILAQNDLSAFGIIEALAEAGVAVPAQVSVIGYDGTEMCEWMSPSLTSVEVPLHRIATTGMEILLRHIDDPDLETSKTVLSVKLQLRSSTAPPMGAAG